MQQIERPNILEIMDFTTSEVDNQVSEVTWNDFNELISESLSA